MTSPFGKLGLLGHSLLSWDGRDLFALQLCVLKLAGDMYIQDRYAPDPAQALFLVTDEGIILYVLICKLACQYLIEQVCK